jgi:hypothetical protein
MTKSTHPKLEGGWHIWRRCVRDYKASWKLFLAIVLIVALPIRLLGLNSALSTDGGFNAYATVASLVMNLAVLSAAYAYVTAKPFSLRQAYYEGTRSFVAYIIASSLLALCLLPAIIGFLFFSAGSSSVGGLGEIIIVGVVAVVLVLPSLWLLVRFILGTVLVATEPLRPVEALKAARQLTLTRFWTVTARLLVLFFWVLLIVLIIAAITTILGLVFSSAGLLSAIFELTTSILVLPLGSLYVVRLVMALRGTLAV